MRRSIPLYFRNAESVGKGTQTLPDAEGEAAREQQLKLQGYQLLCCGCHSQPCCQPEMLTRTILSFLWTQTSSSALLPAICSLPSYSFQLSFELTSLAAKFLLLVMPQCKARKGRPVLSASQGPNCHRFSASLLWSSWVCQLHGHAARENSSATLTAPPEQDQTKTRAVRGNPLFPI